MRYCLTLLALCAAFAQTNPPSFDVASVKRLPPVPPQGGSFSGGVKVMKGHDTDKVTYLGQPLKTLVGLAYQVKFNQLSAPDWMSQERYDIIAEIPTGTSEAQTRRMLQALLAKRFNLAVHMEKKEMPVYALVLGKNGHKLETVDQAEGFHLSGGSAGTQLSGKATMADIADALSGQVDRRVVDMTGLTGIYAFTARFTKDPDGPAVVTQLQEQLGLKFEPRKTEVEMLVVDHAEKVPTDN